MYLLTLCHCLQTRGGFLPSVFFFLIASVEAVLLVGDHDVVERTCLGAAAGESDYDHDVSFRLGMEGCTAHTRVHRNFPQRLRHTTDHTRPAKRCKTADYNVGAQSRTHWANTWRNLATLGAATAKQ